MRVLIACEFSGTVREAFNALGHDAMSCDVLPSEVDGNHYQGDVRDLIGEKFDLLIAHPPCTYLCNSGVHWLHKDASRWDKLIDGAAFFKLFLDWDCPRVCIENPIMHKYAKELIGGVKYSQIVQPYMFGHLESKATCLWLKGLNPLVSTNNVKNEWERLPKKQAQRIHMLPPSKDRGKLRSITFKGIAEAMATQWGKHE